MRIVWIIGVAHAFMGSAIFFLTLHPLRDALDAHALELCRVGAAWQAVQGLALMIAAVATNARIASLLIGGGAAVSMAVLYYIIFTGAQPPFMVAVPIGGAVSFLGFLALLFAGPRSQR